MCAYLYQNAMLKGDFVVLCYLENVCFVCKRMFRYKVDKEDWIQCDKCMHWYHVGCITLSNELYKQIDSNGDIEWTCNKCGMIVIYINFFFPDMLYMYRKW